MRKIINGKLDGILPRDYAFNFCFNICCVFGENSDSQKKLITNQYERNKNELSKLGKEYVEYFNEVDKEIKNML